MRDHNIKSYAGVQSVARRVLEYVRTSFLDAGNQALDVGDEVLASNYYFIDAALHHQEYRRSVRSGEPGSMWEALRELVFAFRGSSSTNYAGITMDMFITFAKELPEDLKIALDVEGQGNNVLWLVR
jgi:hypothetical protein